MAYDHVMFQDVFQIRRSPQVADVVIIGSGAGGGTATKVLADLGINVTLLEAGPMLHPETDFKEHEVALSSIRIAARAKAARAISAAAAISAGSPRTPAAGNWKASPTPSPKDRNSAGSARESWADAPITTAAFRCATPITI